MAYNYRVYQKTAEKKNIRYTRQDLESMGTFLLRDICVREKIMTQGAGLQPQRMERKDLIELLYRYRGKQEDALAEDFPEESVKLLEKMLGRLCLTPDKLEVPFKIAVKRNIPLLVDNAVSIIHEFEGEYFCAVLTDGKGKIQAVFEVKGQYLTLSPNRIEQNLETGLYYDWQLILFDRVSSEKIVQIYNEQALNIQTIRSMTAVSARVAVFALEEAAVSDRPLFVDFGTSNTCAAMMDEEGELLYTKFQGTKLLCPSCAAVKHCGGETADFVFGYEALKLIQIDGYGNSASFYYNIKRFLYEEQKLEAQDKEGSACIVSSDFILEHYLHFIINTAKAEFGIDFREIRFLLPEKRGGFVLQRLRRILNGYRIEAAQSESLNCVYQELAYGLEHMELGDSLPVLVLHCGGGTSSIIRCDYQVMDTQTTYEVRLREQYLNGDCGFGGNNLTWLIMKYLKILIYNQLTGRTEDILGEAFEDAYTLIDESGTSKGVYEGFDNLYEEAETVVPTRFEELDEYRAYKKQNFFRLWFLAERIKNCKKNVVCLPQEFEEYCCVNILDNGYIYEYPIEAQIQRDDIWLVTAPEVYRTMKNFLEPYCNQDGILQGYRIKFSGLSCNLPVFKDAIREFTVGRRARTPKSGRTVLKLRAMEGAVRQEQLLKNGRMIPELKTLQAAASYTVVVQSHNGGSFPIVSQESWENTVFGSVTRHISTREVEFQVCDTSSQTVHRRIVRLARDSFQETDYSYLFNEFPILRTVQGDIDSIGDKDIRLFVFREENWDFSVLPISRKAGVLYRDKVSHFLFDDISGEFFDGRH